MPQQTFEIEVSFHGLGLEDETVQLDQGATFEDLLRERDVHPETVLVFCDDEVVPAEKEVPAGADVRVLRITSGG